MQYNTNKEKRIISNKQRVKLNDYVRDLFGLGLSSTKQSMGTHLLTVDWDKVADATARTGQQSIRPRILKACVMCDIEINGQ